MLDKRSMERIIHQLWQPIDRTTDMRIFAVLDAARDRGIHLMLLDSDNDFFCLYRGERARALADVAPYLVELGREDKFTRSLIGQGWGRSWGIYLQSAAALSQLKSHFRKFVMVYDEARRPLYFRYYDPRVLRVYLPTCNEADLGAIFGPVACYFTEGEESDTMVAYFTSESKLVQSTFRLSDAGRSR